MTLTSEMTNPNVVVVVLAPDQRHTNFNYASRYSYALGGTHIGVAMILIIATVVFTGVYPTIGFDSKTILTLSGCATVSWFYDDLLAPNGKYHQGMRA